MGKKKGTNYEDWRSQYVELPDKKPIEGGNGKVYFVCKDGKELALKQLKESFARGSGKNSREKICRFQREIQIVRKLAKTIPGIVPIHDYSEYNCWYVMPVAEGIMEHMVASENRLIEAADFVLEMADTLGKLHSHGVCHRDIKPDNIYFYEGRCCLSDFGIAGVAELEGRLTPADKQLGAIFTIAPEMKRDPLRADGRKADVYSLAKTLWMLIRNDSKGFDGSYDRRNPCIGLSFASECKGIHIVELEDLLEQATDTSPERRPDVEDFAQGLRLWQEIRKDNRRSQDSEWRYLSKALFAGKQAASATWTDIDVIIAVLQDIARLPAYNHIFLPSKGGLDLIGADRASEEGCLYLMLVPTEIAVVKPKSLTFEGFSEANDWNYFLLELEDMKPALETSDMNCIREVLVEDIPGHYVSANGFVYGVYDYDTGQQLPAEAKLVERYCRGSFLITLKQGPYNQCVDYAYQALHDRIGTENIRVFMSDLRKIKNSCEESGFDFRKLLNQVFMTVDQCAEKTSIYLKERKAYVTKLPKLDVYLQGHLSGWQFFCPTTDRMKTVSGNICYTFVLRPKDEFTLSKGFPEEFILCKDGVFRKNPESNDEFHAWAVDEAKEMLNSLQEGFNEYLSKAGYISEYYMLPCVHVKLKMIEIPTHLVTKEEIRELMFNADDRKDNTLVLDGDGYPHIIQDMADSQFYPVVTETWEAGNCYVGKYADIDGQLETEYTLVLQGLSDYLQRRRSVYVDISFGNVKNLLCEIEERMR